MATNWIRGIFSHTISVGEVFKPGGVPSVTYVARPHLDLEAKVSGALARKHAFIVMSGPTKCGKSVLITRVLQDTRQILVQGGQIESAQDFWKHIAHHAKIPSSKTRTKTSSWSIRSLAELALSIPALLQGKISTDATRGWQKSEALTFNNVALLDALSELRRQDAVLVIEDFHYLDKVTQRTVVRSLKSSVFAGLKVVILAVPHRSFDPTDVETEVEGRVHHVEVPKWSPDDLLDIALKGFSALGIEVPTNVLSRICEDSFGNPLLVQEICYEISETLQGATDTKPIDASALTRIYDNVVDRKGLTRFDRFSSAKPAKSRMVKLRDGGEEEIGIFLLSAVARLGPQQLTSYSEICESASKLSSARKPTLSRVNEVFSGLASQVSDSRTAPLEWLQTQQVLALTDPFLMFYMRWVLRDRRSLTLVPRAIERAIQFQPGTGSNDEVIPK